MSLATVDADAVIVGGGVAGLWTLARLAQAGYGCILLENEALGTGQTIAAQGIIHGGIKYALSGAAGRASEAIFPMPSLWRSALEGRGPVTLPGAIVLSDRQYLWTAPGFLARAAGFLASKMFHSVCKTVDSGSQPAFKGENGRTRLYEVEEQVLDVSSVIRALTAPSRNLNLLLSPSAQTQIHGDGTVELTSRSGRGDLRIRARRLILTAGGGNRELLDNLGIDNAPKTGIASQRRPLHMGLARGMRLPTLYGHCLTTSSKPRVTVTTHRDRQGRVVWHIGGDVAETGVERDHDAQIIEIKRELADCLPWLPWNDLSCEFSTYRVDRAEGLTSDGSRPDEPVWRESGNVIAIWPTKLAFAPKVAEDLLNHLQASGVEPSAKIDPDALAGWNRPEIAVPPWERDDRTWS